MADRELAAVMRALPHLSTEAVEAIRLAVDKELEKRRQGQDRNTPFGSVDELREWLGERPVDVRDVVVMVDQRLSEILTGALLRLSRSHLAVEIGDWRLVGTFVEPQRGTVAHLMRSRV